MTRVHYPAFRNNHNGALKVCLLTYRGNPTCGGQGVYIKYLSTALRDLGHKVDVISGPPYPEEVEGVNLIKVPSLDLYNPDHMFWPENMKDLVYPINQLEFVSMTLGGFPEPLTFGLRVYHHLRHRRSQYDIVHDNQCLSYGILALSKLGIPTTATIHHPITVDRDVDIQAAKSPYKRFKVRRWYSFIRMQLWVSRRLKRIITVSECSKTDISAAFKIPAHKFRVVPNGINMDYFYPLPHIEREDNHLLVTNSADTPLKGLKYLLHAVDSIRKKRFIKLTVVGAPKKYGAIEQLVRELNLKNCVNFTGRIEYEDFARLYASATMAVIPSVYEGFGMPAGEAMACGVPVISTTGGALPEVVGDAGILIPPADQNALEEAIVTLLDDPDRRQRLGEAGLSRVKSAFTWRHAAQKTVEIYKETIDDYGRF